MCDITEYHIACHLNAIESIAKAVSSPESPLMMTLDSVAESLNTNSPESEIARVVERLDMLREMMEKDRLIEVLERIAAALEKR